MIFPRDKLIDSCVWCAESFSLKPELWPYGKGASPGWRNVPGASFVLSSFLLRKTTTDLIVGFSFKQVVFAKLLEYLTVEFCKQGGLVKLFMMSMWKIIVLGLSARAFLNKVSAHLAGFGWLMLAPGWPKIWKVEAAGKFARCSFFFGCSGKYHSCRQQGAVSH